MQQNYTHLSSRRPHEIADHQERRDPGTGLDIFRVWRDPHLCSAQGRPHAYQGGRFNFAKFADLI